MDATGVCNGVTYIDVARCTLVWQNQRHEEGQPQANGAPGPSPQRQESSVVDATALKTALIRANVSQVELARRLGRSRSMVSAWVTDDVVPPEWVPLVYEALHLPPAPAEPKDAVETAIRADPLLTADDKENLLALLTAIRRRRAGP